MHIASALLKQSTVKHNEPELTWNYYNVDWMDVNSSKFLVYYEIRKEVKNKLIYFTTKNKLY
jgi:hypothetical protein